MYGSRGDSGSFPPICSISTPRQTPEATWLAQQQALEVARLAQQQIQEEVERIWGNRSIHSLHQLFSPQELVPANITQLWRYHQLRPEYKDFLSRWTQASRQEIAEVQFSYAYWYQEKRILERIAKQQNIELGCAEVDALGQFNVKGLRSLEVEEPIPPAGRLQLEHGAG
ncbi:hypothetical protein EK21DRAFT_90179 [Setomelanomma holmii]|uniref:Uncharacterized protein n=1 Tax=Setomelanomma holmii TaxID=210430 RepID=A0A9P4H7H5_9PLEO|nr:hypothetical protein EK21DRAFT_90179 [Setomelanomma holmii]